MKVLMFGWEFPPFHMGGLGTACYGLTKGLTEKNVDITFVLPKLPFEIKSHVKLVSADEIKIKLKKITSLLVPYVSSEGYDDIRRKTPFSNIYGKDLFAEVQRFAQVAELLAENEDFDIIHAHDWMTFPAAIRVKKKSGKPLVVHVHATEFDRTGGNSVNQTVYELERQGMHSADHIIAVSNFTKDKIVNHYGIHPDKVTVVHNAIEESNGFGHEAGNEEFKIKEKDKIVLFLGRITLQKGPDYFVYAAKKVLEKMNNVKFVIAGDGDMLPSIINKAAEMGIADKVLFTGFLRGKDIDRAYKMADVYVMPSVSEPFGLTPLEAMRNNTPVIISKQSGVSEVIKHCLKCDFWDVDELANKIFAVLNYSALNRSLKENGNAEIKKLNWEVPANKCIEVYQQLLRH